MDYLKEKMSLTNVFRTKQYSYQYSTIHDTYPIIRYDIDEKQYLS